MDELRDTLRMIQSNMRRSAQAETAKVLANFFPESSSDEMLAALSNAIDPTEFTEALDRIWNTAFSAELREYTINALRSSVLLRTDDIRTLGPVLPTPLVREALAGVRRIGDDAAYTDSLIALTHGAPQHLLQTGLSAARGLSNAGDRASAMVALAPLLHESHFGEVLSSIKEIQNSRESAKALAALIPYIPDPMIPEAFAISCTSPALVDHVECIVALIPRLSESLLPKMLSQALYVIKGIQNSSGVAEALSALIPYLPNTMIPEAFAIARTLPDFTQRVECIISLIPRLPESLLSEVLSLLRQIERMEHEYIDKVDVTLSHFGRVRDIKPGEEWLSDAQLGHRTRSHGIDDLRLAFFDPFWPVKLFRALAPYLSGDLLQEALALARGIEGLNTHGQNQLITKILEQRGIPGINTLLRAILGVLEGSRATTRRAMALAYLAPKFPESQSQKILGEALSIIYQQEPETANRNYVAESNSVLQRLEQQLFRLEGLKPSEHNLEQIASQVTTEFRITLLAILIPHFSEYNRNSILHDLLLEVRSIKDDTIRRNYLSKLMPYLHERLQYDTLREDFIKDNNKDRFYNMSMLLPNLCDPLRREVLTTLIESSQNIESKRERVDALCKLIPYTTEPFKEEALRAAYNTAMTIKNENEYWETVKILASVLPKSLLQEALTKEFPISKVESISILLHLPCNELMDLDRTSLYSIWKRMLHVLASSTRQDFLSKLGEMTGAIKRLGGEAAVVATVKGVETVRQWWP